MKKHFGIFVLALLTSVASCKNDGIEADCTDCGKRMGKVKDRQGRIMLDQKTGRYLVLSHIPGTIDASRAGYLCDLPENYQEEGKEVIVSGTAYETTLRFQRPICCVDENYCLTISSIEDK